MNISGRPIDWKDIAPPPLPNTLTFAAQADLPSLPVPILTDTLARIRSSVKPLATSDVELDTTENVIRELGATGGIGETLQKRLEQRAKEKRNWLEEYYDDSEYLRNRLPVRDFSVESFTG